MKTKKQVTMTISFFYNGFYSIEREDRLPRVVTAARARDMAGVRIGADPSGEYQVDYSPRKESQAWTERLKNDLASRINWVDGWRTLGDMLKGVNVVGRFINVQTHRFGYQDSAYGFIPLPNPVHEYVLWVRNKGDFFSTEVIVSEQVFCMYSEEINLRHKRSSGVAV